MQLGRPYDFCSPPEPESERRITGPWRIAMKGEAGNRRWQNPLQDKKRTQTVEPVFGIIESAIGFIRFHLRGLQNAAD